MGTIRFRKRTETKHIYCHLKDLGNKTLHELFRVARQNGEYDTGYHYLIHRNGLMEKDRPSDAVAQYNFKDSEVSVYVLVDSHDGKLNDAQRFQLEGISNQWNLAIEC